MIAKLPTFILFKSLDFYERGYLRANVGARFIEPEENFTNSSIYSHTKRDAESMKEN
ncbi:unnamed protein product, partial [marine sediment metagenome]